MALGSVLAKQSAILLLRKNGDDFNVWQTGGVATTSTTFVDALTLTFTPSQTNDYLLIAKCALKGSDIAKFMTVQLLNVGTGLAYNARTTYVRHVEDFAPWVCLVRQTALSGSQTFKLQINAQSGGTTTISQMSILALNLSAFPNYYYAETRTVQTTSSASFQDAAVVTATPNNNEHIELMAASIRRLTNNGIVECRGLRDSEIVSLSAHTPQATAGDAAFHFSVSRRYPTPVSHTWKMQWRSPPATASASILDAAVCIIEASDAPSVSILGNTSILGNVLIR